MKTISFASSDQEGSIIIPLSGGSALSLTFPVFASIIIKKEFVQWSPYAQRWIEATGYGSEERDGLWRYNVLCSKTGNTYEVSSKGLMLIKSAKKEE